MASILLIAIIVIPNKMLCSGNDRKKQAYHITKGVFAVLFAAGGPITISSLSFASPSSGSVDDGGAKMYLDEAIKALQAGDSAGAEMHMTEADKVLQEGAAKMYLGEAIKALQAGDTEGAETHAQMAQDNL